ncbi:hypothetical protein GCM10009583_22990 [Ornithinicoccus hortensis]
MGGDVRRSLLAEPEPDLTQLLSPGLRDRQRDPHGKALLDTGCHPTDPTPQGRPDTRGTAYPGDGPVPPSRRT